MKARKAIREVFIRGSNRLFGTELTHRSKIAHGLMEIFNKTEQLLNPNWRVQQKFERENPNVPWFVPDSIKYIEQIIQPHYVGWEWGSGRSSIWFAERVKQHYCVEGRRAWYNQMTIQISEQNLEDKIHLQLAEVTSEYEFDLQEVERYAATIDVMNDGSLDYVIVDGHFRLECLKHCLPKIRGGGYLIIDNSDLHTLRAFYANLEFAEKRVFSNGLWETTIITALPDGF